MFASDKLSRVHDAGLIAIVRADSSDEAVHVVGALLDGGVPAVELTFTTPGVDHALREVRKTYGDSVLIGAGTIRTLEQVELAVAAGADFLVSPNLRPEVLSAMLATGLPTVPGVFTPSEIDLALELGAEVVKLFPASIGGPGHLKALRGPFPDLQVIPTGGVNLQTLTAWFSAGAFAVGVGGEICARPLMREGNWLEITRRAKQFADATRTARHPCRNCVVTRYFTFVGVTTGQSSIMRIFPRWRDLLQLGEDIEVQGRDLPMHASPERYREVVAEIKNDPAHLGGLVTTHKLDLYHAASDLFTEVDEYARVCDEVSCIAKRDGNLWGWAKDPISAGKSLDGILGTDYFGRTGGDVLCYGAGGSGVAISLYLMTRPNVGDRPRRMIITNRSPGRLEHLRHLHSTIDSDVEFEYIQSADPVKNDGLMARLPAGSVVINATGMGKDSPGSPITDNGVFPQNGVAWEINYRGELGFLYQAWDQRQERKVRVEDGWEYFIYGWTCVMEEVFDLRFTPTDIKELSKAAEFARPSLPTNRVAHV